VRHFNHSNSFQTNRFNFKRPSSPQTFQQNNKLQRINHIANSNVINTEHSPQNVNSNQNSQIHHPNTSGAPSNDSSDNFLD
jgi:spore maturation protein CgeB